MAGRQVSEWDVINRFLTWIIGSHRRRWSLGTQRMAAADGVWNDLVEDLLGSEVEIVTDSNMNTSCVFEIPSRQACLYVSTVLPFFVVWSAADRRFLDYCPDWVAILTKYGFLYLGSSSTRTLSPYRDEEADRRITYYEILFEWIEGSDGPAEHELINPWQPER